MPNRRHLQLMSEENIILRRKNAAKLPPLLTPMLSILQEVMVGSTRLDVRG